MLSSSVVNTGHAVPGPRKRAARACQSCHARKVRCSLSQTGTPCTNCSLDHLVCEPRVTKRKRLERHGTRNQRPGAASLPVNNPRAYNSPQSLDNPEASENPTHCRNATNDHDVAVACISTDDGNTETPYRLLTEHFSHHGRARDQTETSHANEGSPEGRYSPIFGDPRGVALVASICEPECTGRSGHFFVPQTCPPHVDPHTNDYLRLKGVFELPSPDVCEMLIKTYFHHVHPFFPVVDAMRFIETFESPRRNKLSIHLLWSMFLAAANFVDDATLRAAEFPSRKEMKRSVYTKAKALYDAEYERRKITLIQAVLLMGFWYADTEDRTGPWHWNGVAIGLCQTIGLHRDPDRNSSHVKTISVHDRRLWRQLWWSCFYREVWFSAGMGRPMRIRLVDCNIPMPDANEVEEELAGLSSTLRDKYISDSSRELHELWTNLLNLTVTLADILVQQHQAERSLPSDAEVERIETRIRACYDRHGEAKAYNADQIVFMHAYHLELYVESVSLVLYRPFLFPNLADSFSEEWKLVVERKTRTAAATTNRVLSNMITADMIHLCQPMVCIALVPALQIHLLDYRSQRGIVQRMGYQHLELCMIVIEELKKTFFGAEILYRIFTKAQRQIRDRRLPDNSTAPVTQGSGAPTSPRTMDTESVIGTSQDVCQDNQDESDPLSAIWSSFTPMIPYDFFDEAEFLLQTC